MDIHDINHRYGISLKKLRRMHRDGVLRVGKSELPKYWQMLRADIHKSKLSARSIALAYRYPCDLEKIMDLSRRQRSLIEKNIVKLDLPKIPPSPVKAEFRIPTVACGAVVDKEIWLERFITVLKSHIPQKIVDYHYIAVRILLMCESPQDIDATFKFLAKAISKARDHPSMAGWWSKQKTENEGECPSLFHRPTATFDL